MGKMEITLPLLKMPLKQKSTKKTGGQYYQAKKGLLGKTFRSTGGIS